MRTRSFCSRSVSAVALRSFLAAASVALVVCSSGSVWYLAAAGENKLAAAESTAGLTIDAAVPGGNSIVDRIEGDHVYLHQDPRDTERFWFYWHFRARGAGARTLTFHFTKGNVVGVRGPAVSTDGGKTWSWLGPMHASPNTFAYHFSEDAAEVRFCLAMPYVEANLREFLGRHAQDAHLKAATLATTKKGRAVERLHVGKLDGPPEHRVLLTARHHACEMMASWAQEGLLEAVLADDDTGRWLRQHVEFLALPFIDKDGVEEGDQGKNRRPHDHNRDYLAQSIYPAVAALREFVPNWSEGRLRLALDMHCPYLRSGGAKPGRDEQIFFVGPPSEKQWAELERFSQVLEETQTGPLRYRRQNNLPFGMDWNTLAEARSCGRWAGALPGIRLATTIEIPYASAGGEAVTIDSARALGHDLAGTVRRYLQTLQP